MKPSNYQLATAWETAHKHMIISENYQTRHIAWILSAISSLVISTYTHFKDFKFYYTVF